MRNMVDKLILARIRKFRNLAMKSAKQSGLDKSARDAVKIVLDEVIDIIETTMRQAGKLD